MKTMVEITFKITNNTFDMIVMRNTGIMHVKASLLDSIGKFRTCEGDILESSSETTIKRGIGKGFTIRREFGSGVNGCARRVHARLGEEIKNILVCEGVQRLERHEKLSQWEMHMQRCEVDHVPLSFEAIREGKERLMSYGLKQCKSDEDNADLLLCWGATRLYSISAWRPHSSNAAPNKVAV